MRHTRPLVFWLATTLLLSALPSSAATLADVTMPDRIDAGGNTLVLNGLGLRNKFIVKVYVGGLYLAAKESAPAKILSAESPRRMAFHFLYSVKKQQMCDAFDEGLEANTPKANAEVKKNFTTLCTYLEDIPKGSTMNITFVPGQGIQVEVNGKVKGTLFGKPTADAILATWIGPKPPTEDLKNGVLGGK